MWSYSLPRLLPDGVRGACEHSVMSLNIVSICGDWDLTVQAAEWSNMHVCIALSIRKTSN
jgi:hypothetical protein